MDPIYLANINPPNSNSYSGVFLPLNYVVEKMVVKLHISANFTDSFGNSIY